MTTVIDKYVPKKYHRCIDDYYKDIDGYWLELKEEYISTSTGTHTIHELTIKDLKQELKNIVYNIDGIQIPIRNNIKVYDPLYDETFFTDEKELKLFAEDEVAYCEEYAENLPKYKYYRDKNNKVVFTNVCYGMEYLLGIDIVINDKKTKIY